MNLNNIINMALFDDAEGEVKLRLTMVLKNNRRSRLRKPPERPALVVQGPRHAGTS